MKGTGFILLGILLIGLAALWFLTPLSEMLMPKTVMAPQDVPGEGYATRSPNGTVKSLFGWAEIVVDGLNAAFGAVGLYFTIKGLRLRGTEKKVDGDEA